MPTKRNFLNIFLLILQIAGNGDTKRSTKFRSPSNILKEEYSADDILHSNDSTLSVFPLSARILGLLPNFSHFTDNSKSFSHSSRFHAHRSNFDSFDDNGDYDDVSGHNSNKAIRSDVSHGRLEIGVLRDGHYDTHDLRSTKRRSWKSRNSKSSIKVSDPLINTRTPLKVTATTPLHRLRIKRRVSGVRQSRNSGGLDSLAPVTSLRNEGKQSSGNPKIDDIISGIVKLLKGNVKLKGSEAAHTAMSTPVVSPLPVSRSRINNRGPPRLTMPFELFPTLSDTTGTSTHSSATENLMSYSNHHRDYSTIATEFSTLLNPSPSQMNSIPIPNRSEVKGFPIPENVLSSVSPNLYKLKNSGNNLTLQDILPSFLSPVDKSSDSLSLVNESPSSYPSISKSTDEPLSLITIDEISPLAVASTVMPVELQSATTTSSFSTSEATPTLVTTTSVKVIGTISGSGTTLGPSVLSAISESSSTQTTSETFSSTLLPQRLPSLTSTSTSIYEIPALPTRLPGPIHRQRPKERTRPYLGGSLRSSTRVPSYTGQVITANQFEPFGGQPEVFDVTVSALQGYGAPPHNTNGYTRIPNNAGGNGPLIISSKPGGAPQEGSVYIDGRKTYFNLHPGTATKLNHLPTVGIGTVIPETVRPVPSLNTRQYFRPSVPPLNTNLILPTKVINAANPSPSSNPTRRPLLRGRPTLGPPKRIDTCIVGFDKTCKEELGEVCRTEGDVSSCFCRPGTSRKRARTKCQKIVSLHLSLKVDRIGARRIWWSGNYVNPRAEEYKELYFEAEKALDSAFGQSKMMSDWYVESSVNKFYSLGGRVIVNSTVKLLDNPRTSTPSIRKNIQRQLIKVIQSNSNFVGDSLIAVEGPLNPIPDVSDINECFDSSLYDCHSDAVCSNTFGGYTCSCLAGFTDRYPDDPLRSGRFCDTCSRDFCSKRGECRIEQDGTHLCVCEDSFYGSRCELDGEVIAVAVGASIAAVIIIVVTLVFLCMWSQRWKAQDQKSEILSRVPGGFLGSWGARGPALGDTFAVNVHQKTTMGGTNSTYGVSLEDRIRWAQMAESLATPNIYAKTSRRSKWTLLKDAVGNILPRGRGRSHQNEGGVFPRLTQEEALILHQMIAQQQQQRHQQQQSIDTLDNQPEQIRSSAIYNEQRKQMGLQNPSEYALMGSTSGLQSPQNFGLQLLKPSPYHAMRASGNYGPPSAGTTPSIGGISRAPTLNAQSPLPITDLLGGPLLMGPAGGGVVAKKGKKDNIVHTLLPESSEDDPERPYHLPRPKSRSSALDNDDLYFEPDDFMTSRRGNMPPKPSSPPPPIPFFHFDQFYKSNFP